MDFGYRTWKPLGAGDTIYIIAPSNGFSDKESLLQTLSFLNDFSLSNFKVKIKYDINAFNKKDLLCPEKAMSTEASFLDVMAAFNDPEVKAIWAIKGGRLSLEMWALLETQAKSFPFKPLLGFSDITSLHLFFNRLGYATIHCPVLSYFKESPTPHANKLTSLKSTFDILMGKTPIVTYKGFIPHNKVAQDLIAPIEGILLGGNLSSIQFYDSVYETPDIPTIWMIETVDDYTRIESILEALKAGKIFKNAQAIIFGHLHGKSYSDSNFSTVQNRCELIIKRFSQKINIPIFSVMVKGEDSTFCFGHGDLNHPFPLGTKAVLQVGADKKTILTISSS
ncbi:MAG: LD-carboxypeptidase [Candidatus Babeliales bacterium]|nr:LD-carboxypeptidase [Candidatus Babeliales bacterium]